MPKPLAHTSQPHKQAPQLAPAPTAASQGDLNGSAAPCEEPPANGSQERVAAGRGVAPPPPPRRADQLPTAAAAVRAFGAVDSMRCAGPVIGRREVIGWSTSCLFHGALLFVLGLLFLDGPQASSPRTLLATLLEPRDGPLEQLVWEVPRMVPVNSRISAPQLLDDPAAEPVEVQPPEPAELPRGTSSAGTMVGPLGSLSARWFEPFGLAQGGGLEGRTAEARARWVAEAGGTPESEQAVERGLRWLAAHQCDDGSWNFDHWKSHCHGYCRDPGTAATTTGATGVVLMAFLGAGYTHREGPHQEVVRRGLYYLTRRALLSPEGADLQEGTMYGQGLATIAVCEAYAMTRDPQLRGLAHDAIRFIDRAQDKRGGGWRYNPGQPGDTTVTGWQLMALKSAQLAGLQVPSPTLLLVERFLDSVQSDQGAQYGYLTPEPRKTTTAIGLLCRMYTGWPRNHPGLQRGVGHLASWGPSEDDLYYNYYATQVLRHWGGSDWQRWNRKMRDHLVATQSTRGHEAGSWFFSGGGIESGGRVLNTALAVMILEVYYRYLPLYQERAFQSPGT